MKHRSLLTQLTLRLVGVGIVLTVLNAVLVSIYYGRDIAGLRRDSASRQIDVLAGRLERDENGKVGLRSERDALAIYTANPEAYALRIVDARDEVIAEANAAMAPEGLQASYRGTDFWTSEFEVDGRSVLLMSRRVSGAAGPARITFASVGDPAGLVTAALLDELYLHIVISLLPFAFCLLVVTAITVRQSLRPLKATALAAERTGRAGEIGKLPTDSLPAEVLPLVVAINGALKRLDDVLESERAFTAEAAHALRTPLAVLSARLGTLPASPQSREIDTDLAALERLVAQLLSAAQADTLVLDPDQRCDLAEVARTTVADLAPLAIRQGRSLAYEGADGIPIQGDGDAIGHAVRNLIENALRFTPEGTEVTVRAIEAGELSVLDRGPGIPPERRELALKRFWRSATSELGGTGLGLPIAQRIAEAHGATLRFGERAGGGFEVALVGFTRSEAARRG